MPGRMGWKEGECGDCPRSVAEASQGQLAGFARAIPTGESMLEGVAAAAKSFFVAGHAY